MRIVVARRSVHSLPSASCFARFRFIKRVINSFLFATTSLSSIVKIMIDLMTVNPDVIELRIYKV